MGTDSMSMAPLPRDQWYDSRLVRAILNNDFVEAQVILATGFRLEQRIDGSTFLHKCIQLKKWSMADLLIDRGADVNARDPDGFMPLHLAVRHRRPELAMKLMAKGADRHATDNHQRKPSDLPQAGMSIDWTHLSGNARLAGTFPASLAASFGSF
jgi:ankyrin repeat protein